jgi:hypothetical protein
MEFKRQNLNDKSREDLMATMNRRVLLRSAAAAGAATLLPRAVRADDSTGITATEGAGA